MDDTAAKDTYIDDELKLKSAAVESSEDPSEETSSSSKLYTDPNDGTQYEKKKRRAWFPKVVKTDQYNKLVLQF